MLMFLVGIRKTVSKPTRARVPNIFNQSDMIASVLGGQTHAHAA